MARSVATAWTAIMALGVGGCSSAGADDAGGGGRSAGAGGSDGSGGDPATTASAAVSGSSSSSSAIASTSAGAGGGAFACDPPAEPGSLYELSAGAFGLPDPISMCQYRGDVMLVVNTAAL